MTSRSLCPKSILTSRRLGGTSQPKRIKEAFGWMKTIGGTRRPMQGGTGRVGWSFTFAAACNLVRLPKLLAETEP